MEKKVNPYAPPPNPPPSDLSSQEPHREVESAHSVTTFFTMLGITLSFAFIEYGAVRLALQNRFLLAIPLGTLALMHIPLAVQRWTWSFRFLCSLTIPFSVGGAAGAFFGFMLFTQFAARQRIPLDAGMTRLAGFVVLLVGGTLGAFVGYLTCKRLLKNWSA